MAYIGNIPAEAYTNTVKDSFNGDGSTVAFTMSLPSATNDVRVVVENVVQDPTVAYSCSGTTLTFTSAPVSGTANIYVVHLGAAVMTTIPPSEIADATTFASNVTVQGAFTSQGIDDNATSTAMTLDGSGNLLVGKTSDSFSTVGSSYRANGSISATATANEVLDLNRLSTDGNIMRFFKDGTTVGSIGTAQSGDRTYFSGGSYGIASDTSDATIMPCNTTGGGNNGVVSLGKSDARFKDLYLSGGVFLGGTGSANKLEDYEAGVCNIVIRDSSGNSATMTETGCRYTKTGNLVYLTGTLAWASTAAMNTSRIQFHGIPFTSASNPAAGTYRSPAIFGSASSGAFTIPREEIVAGIDPSASFIWGTHVTGNNVDGPMNKTHLGTSGNIYGFGIIYHTN